jgi:dCMP deaminase
MYLTLSPCSTCALGLIQSGVKRVVYLDEYRDTSGIEILKKCNIKVNKITL